jgi:SAM-dependent methyltransferase
MRTRWSPNATISFNEDSVSASNGYQTFVIEPAALFMLELFVHHKDIADAHQVYSELTEALRSDRAPKLAEIKIPQPAPTLLLIHDSVVICPASSASEARKLTNLRNKANWGITSTFSSERVRSAMREVGAMDLTIVSRRTPLVGNAVASSFSLRAWPDSGLNVDEFSVRAESLARNGLLSIPFREVHLGDFGLAHPLCPDYGFSRGTPIDRFYLSQFVGEVRDRIVGSTLEVGGRTHNRKLYGLTATTEYVTMDVAAGSNADIEADVHNPLVCPARRFDSIIIFNVLEHCKEPWTVVDNIHRWLKPGGRVFCVVPNAQRIHRGPQDYWRILPDAMRSLFRRFATTTVKGYGNLLTSNASMCGISAEELRSEILNMVDERYPVMLSVVASKK